MYVSMNSHGGHYCGYLVIPVALPYIGPNSDQLDISLNHLHIHGGITFYERDINFKERKTSWVLGFDCAHGGDYSPGYDSRLPRPTYPSFYVPETRYRTISFVRKQLTMLARQIHEIKVGRLPVPGAATSPRNGDIAGIA